MRAELVRYGARRIQRGPTSVLSNLDREPVKVVRPRHVHLRAN